MKKVKIKQIMAVLLAVITMITAVPFGAVNIFAANGTASLSNIGELGTVNIGNKSESGNWLQTKINGKPAFCLDLGKACHSGYVYESTEKTISSDSKNTADKLKAKIGYWYYTTKKHHLKAWVYAQSLIWSVEEGVTSESGLKDVIKQVKNNTGYYSTDEIYKDIFEIKEDVECTIYIWKYAGNTDDSQVQRLMQIKSDSIEEEPPEYYPLSKTKRYRQRITLRKYGENGELVPHVTFTLKAKNIKELYTYKANGWGSAESGDVDEDATKFEVTYDTDSKGMITYKFDYQLQSVDYYYYKEDDLAKMDNDDIKAAKKVLDLEGYKYATDLSKKGAEELADKNIMSQFNKVSNQYVITEVATNNDDLLLDAEYAEGKTITLTSKDSWFKEEDGWPDTTSGTYADYKLTYRLGITNRYKKITVNVKKADGYSNDKKAYGNATLDGAEFRLFEDAGCIKPATVYDASGKKKTAGVYKVVNGTFETDYLKTGKSFFLKEIKQPVGYLLNSEVKEIKAGGANYNVEFTPNAQTIEFREMPILGKVGIQKVKSDGSTGNAEYEKGAVFQVYLKSKGSYEKCSDYERDTVTTDSEGRAVTKDLYYGTYIVHQVSTGGADTEMVSDFEVMVEENGKTYSYLLNNAPFKAYLKVVKKDLNTSKTVLKKGTKYQFFKVDDNGKETLYTQSYSNGKEMITVDTFETDESGAVMTVKPVESGTYRIRETDSAEGLHIVKEYVEVKVSSKNPDCIINKDSDGNTHITIEVDYVNKETQGKLTVVKTGEELIGYGYNEDFVFELNNPLTDMSVFKPSGLNKDFIYQETYLKGTEFEIHAKEDIKTQDNQGTDWFKKGELVAVLTTGEGVTFTNGCNGLCSYSIDKDTGAVTVFLPLGKYTVKETKVNYGYVLPDIPEWDVEFTWENKDQTYVVDKSGVTDENGELHVFNERAKAEISIHKADSVTGEPVKDTVFGFYTKDNIYNAYGELIVDKGTLLTTVKTDENGYAKVDIDIQLMSKGYDRIADNNLNSGDYYFKELSISDSYYLDETPIDVHVEYLGENTAVVNAAYAAVNTQTETEIDKYSVFGSSELYGCRLNVSDTDGNVIVSWITGNADSIVITEKSEELGYRNLTAKLNEKGSIVIKGLLHDKEYVLTEESPKDGFVTAKDIRFKPVEKRLEDKSVTETYILNENGEYVKADDNRVIMYDDTTKVEFSKTDITGENEVPGCDMEVKEKGTDSVIEKWTTTKHSHIIEGKLAAGKTYLLSETRPADGYVTAESIEFTVKDTGELQTVTMKDDVTKIEFSKIASDTDKQLKGAEYRVYDSKGKVVYKFVTGKETEKIYGVLTAGETYTFKEMKVPDNYAVAEDVKITVKDTGKVQKVKAIDKRIPKVPDTPQTGINSKILYGIEAVIIALLLYVYVKRRRNGKKNKDE